MKNEDEDENEEDNLSDNDDDEDEDDEKPMKAPKKRKAPTKKPSTRLVDVPVPGPGPWWVFMMVNGDADEDTKKQTEIRTHTYPELTQAIKNRRDHGSWIIVQKMGPFYRYFDAGKVYALWSNFTRGPGPRVAQGICVWERYGQSLGVDMWVIDQDKEKARQVFKQREELKNKFLTSGDLVPGDDRLKTEVGSVTLREIVQASGANYWSKWRKKPANPAVARKRARTRQAAMAQTEEGEEE